MRVYISAPRLALLEGSGMRLTRRVRKLLWTAVWIACCQLGQAFSSEAHAQVKPGGDPGNSSGNDAYQSLVQQALHEYERGNFNEARAFFARAHALSPNARTLRGLGMSAYELRNYVEAITFFQQALSSDQRPLTAPLHDEVAQLLGQARSFVTHVQLAVEPQNADVRIDTRPTTRDTDGSVLLDPGTHELVIEAPDHEPTTRTLRTDGAETLALHIVLKPSAAPGEVRPTLVHAAPASRPARSEQSGAGSWILIAAGGAVAIAGGVLLGVALSNKHAVEHPEASGTMLPAYADYKDRADLVFPLSTAGIAGIGLGAASVLAGVVWKLAASGRDERAELRLGPGQLHVRLRF